MAVHAGLAWSPQRTTASFVRFSPGSGAALKRCLLRLLFDVIVSSTLSFEHPDWAASKSILVNQRHPLPSSDLWMFWVFFNFDPTLLFLLHSRLTLLVGGVGLSHTFFAFMIEQR